MAGSVMRSPVSEAYGWLSLAKPGICAEKSKPALFVEAEPRKLSSALDDKRCYASDVSRAMAGSIYAKQSLCIQSMRSECWLYYAKPDAKQVLAFLCEAGCLCQI
jgi:hypothetical protein